MKTTLQAGNFAVVRTPLLPLSVFQDWCSSPDPDIYILKLYEQPLVDEALYLSSQSLHARLVEYRNGEGDAVKFETERKKLVATLAKFISRAAYRCTPFGLFAQIQFLTEGKNVKPDTRSIRRGIHLDGAIEARLIEAALADHGWRENLSWRVSNTAYVVGSHLSYVDWVYTSTWQRTYRAVELSLHEGLLLLKNHCQTPQSFQSIGQLLMNDPDISQEEAYEFLHQAIDKRLLLPDFAPSGTDRCSLDQTLEKCGDHPAIAPLKAIQMQLHALRAKANTEQSLIPEYEAMHKSIVALIGNKEMSNGIFQIDSAIEQDAHFDKEQADRLVKALQCIAENSVSFGTSMQDYKSHFRARFEDREVNLAYALHPELGVPFPHKGWMDTELFDGLKLAREFQGGSGVTGLTIKPIDKLLIKRLFENKEAANIEITEAELQELGTTEIPRGAVAEGLYVQVNILPGQKDQTQQIELRHMGGRNGLELLARFTHLNPRLEAATKNYSIESRVNKEDVIYAEIVHHPQDRLLNILRRPRLYEYDIVFAGSSDLPREKQFWLEDLSIQLSGERLVLRERKSGKQVIPRLTSAHNYSATQLGVYQFLAMLQDDDSGWIGFNWPSVVRSFDYLPRVTIAGLIVSRAQWTINKEAIETLNQAHLNLTLEAWRNTHKLPRYVTFDQGDNHLPVDLLNPASVSTLLDEIIKLPSMQLYECLTLNGAFEYGMHESYSQ
ncbi:MAG: lantibiotic dehydratase family protein, partial [Undibacterium sp.]|nr:lantibiotic dehydratase family protein [Undibacterium sp.]